VVCGSVEFMSARAVYLGMYPEYCPVKQSNPGGCLPQYAQSSREVAQWTQVPAPGCYKGREHDADLCLRIMRQYGGAAAELQAHPEWKPLWRIPHSQAAAPMLHTQRSRVVVQEQDRSNGFWSTHKLLTANANRKSVHQRLRAPKLRCACCHRVS
jgi:hypothetical protein